MYKHQTPTPRCINPYTLNLYITTMYASQKIICVFGITRSFSNYNLFFKTCPKIHMHNNDAVRDICRHIQRPCRRSVLIIIYNPGLMPVRTPSSHHVLMVQRSNISLEHRVSYRSFIYHNVDTITYTRCGAVYSREAVSYNWYSFILAC